MALEKYRHKPKFDENGKEIEPAPSYVNIDVMRSDLRIAVHGPYDFSSITNRRLSVIDHE